VFGDNPSSPLDLQTIRVPICDVGDDVSTFLGDLAANGLTCAARQLSPSSFGEQMPRFRADYVPLLATSSPAAELGSPSARRT